LLFVASYVLCTVQHLLLVVIIIVSYLLLVIFLLWCIKLCGIRVRTYYCVYCLLFTVSYLLYCWLLFASDLLYC